MSTFKNTPELHKKVDYQVIANGFYDSTRKGNYNQQ
jgi:hypothetical protein